MAINLKLASHNNPKEQWSIIREAYKGFLPKIMEAESKDRGIDPYCLDWFGSFSPIEKIVWHDIRCNGGRFYPQFPALKYFLDFANPYKKIGIEADGAQWHDINKDAERDWNLVNAGWKIFRIKGREAWNSINPPEFDYDADEDIKYNAMSDWFMNTSEGVIVAIQTIYFNPKPYYLQYRNLCLKTLNDHRIINFSL